jgi:hypothetical protein
MKRIPQYLEIGIRMYKTKPIARGLYSVWQCTDLCSLKYLGEWSKQQLLKCWEYGELI